MSGLSNWLSRRTHDEVPADRPPREANVTYVDDLLAAEIASANTRKESQEATARWIIVTVGLVITLLLGLANNNSVLSEDSSGIPRAVFVATLVLAAGAAGCSMGTLWPRGYERIGTETLDAMNNDTFLDAPTHYVVGTLMSTRTNVLKTANAWHEKKAWWLKWALRLLVIAFGLLIAQGVVLAVDPANDDAAGHALRLAVPPSLDPEAGSDGTP